MHPCDVLRPIHNAEEDVAEGAPEAAVLSQRQEETPADTHLQRLFALERAVRTNLYSPR